MSVVVPAYQAASTIVRSVSSAIGQSLPPDEVIVVDDASTDDTSGLVERAFGGRVHVYRLSEGVGAGGARNFGIGKATGKYVAFLDADDEWHPDKLTLQVPLLDADPGVELVTCDTRIVVADGTTWFMHEILPPSSGTEAWKALLARNFIATPTVVARRHSLLELGGFDPQLVVGEDLDLWIRLARRGAVAIVPERLVTVHGQPNSLTRRTPDAERRYVYPMIRKHVQEAGTHLLPAERRRALGQPAFDFAYRAWLGGETWNTLPLFFVAFRNGYRRAKALTFPPRIALRAIVKWLRGR